MAGIRRLATDPISILEDFKVAETAYKRLVNSIKQTDEIAAYYLKLSLTHGQKIIRLSELVGTFPTLAEDLKTSEAEVKEFTKNKDTLEKLATEADATLKMLIAEAAAASKLSVPAPTALVEAKISTSTADELVASLSKLTKEAIIAAEQKSREDHRNKVNQLVDALAVNFKLQIKNIALYSAHHQTTISKSSSVNCTVRPLLKQMFEKWKAGNAPKAAAPTPQVSPTVPPPAAMPLASVDTNTRPAPDAGAGAGPKFSFAGKSNPPAKPAAGQSSPPHSPALRYPTAG